MLTIPVEYSELLGHSEGRLTGSKLTTMPSADAPSGQTAYQQKELNASFFDDGRELALLHYVYSQSDAVRGSPSKVLAAIDNFGQQQKYLMNVGTEKGRIVSQLIEQTKPKVMVELGAYVGYSAVLFADAARRAGGERYYSLERDATFAAVTTAFLELAGLGSFAKVVVGGSAESIKSLFDQGKLTTIDMLFLDHYKPAYTTDLKLCEELGLIHPGTVLAADNVISPGNPPYLAYVRSTTEQKKKALIDDKAAGDDRDGFVDRTKNQYQKKQGDETLGSAKGNPNIVYESQLVESFEPTGEPDGVEITRCIAVEG